MAMDQMTELLHLDLLKQSPLMDSLYVFMAVCADVLHLCFM